MTPYRIGILGGMGPLAGIELHRLIVETTPAQRDQDHLQVVLFTDPSIPDRTTSLATDNGASYVSGVVSAMQVLEQTKPNVIVMACMTAHSRLNQIQAQISTPILSGIQLVQEEAARIDHDVLLLATDGSINSGLYTKEAPGTAHIITPPTKLQRRIMEIIYAIKRQGTAGQADALANILDEYQPQLQTKHIILGCTELGLLYDELTDRGYTCIDPLRLLAQQLVKQSSDPAYA